jgi:dolichol-phosphate mannosyltransferase
MDADLQHPPSLIPKMVEEYKQGVEIVNMVCTNRADAGWLKKLTSRLFYKMINRISPVQFAENASDFFLISGRVASILKENFRERARFLRGFIQIIGFKKSTLSFDAVSRQGGKSKYSLYRLFVLSMGAIVSFSKLPLHLGIVVGAIFSVFSLLVGGYSIYMKFVGETPPGYTTLVVFMSMSFAIMFFLIGIIGVYIGYNFDENKKRPHYLIATKQGFEQF